MKMTFYLENVSKGNKLLVVLGKCEYNENRRLCTEFYPLIIHISTPSHQFKYLKPNDWENRLLKTGKQLT